MKRMLLLGFWFLASSAVAQEQRLNDYNNINWFQFNSKVKWSNKWSLHLEYQMRKTDGLKAPQQNLLRFGPIYQVSDQLNLHLGYAWVKTYPYGDYPIAATGTFPEHRIYQQVLLNQKLQNWALTHRFRLEQRWLAKVDALNSEISDWVFLNRFRYQFKLQTPFLNLGSKMAYLAVSDELFIGFGKNLGINIFDQNRFIAQLGLKLSTNYAIELGYISQILQQGKSVGGQAVIQKNEGVVITSAFSF